MTFISKNIKELSIENLGDPLCIYLLCGDAAGPPVSAAPAHDLLRVADTATLAGDAAAARPAAAAPAASPPAGAGDDEAGALPAPAAQGCRPTSCSASRMRQVTQRPRPCCPLLATLLARRQRAPARIKQTREPLLCNTGVASLPLVRTKRTPLRAGKSKRLDWKCSSIFRIRSGNIKVEGCERRSRREQNPGYHGSVAGRGPHGRSRGRRRRSGDSMRRGARAQRRPRLSCDTSWREDGREIRSGGVILGPSLFFRDFSLSSTLGSRSFRLHLLRMICRRKFSQTRRPPRAWR